MILMGLMARPSAETSNRLFSILEQWNTVLKGTSLDTATHGERNNGLKIKDKKPGSASFPEEEDPDGYPEVTGCEP
jgi:hypothetical protein